MTDALLTYRRAVAALTPALGRTRCHHCGMPWGEGNRQGRTVYDTYDDSQGWPRSGTFVVCQWCWPNVPADMLLFYAAGLVLGVWPLTGVPLEQCVRDWPRIRRAYEDAAASRAICPTCRGHVASLLAGCPKPECRSADLAEDHRMARREDR